MVVYKLVLSNSAPALRNAVWAKPVSGGFALYLLESGTWKSLKLVDGDGNAVDTDSVVTDFSDVIGENTDDKNTMTLYGLKAYIDDAIANLPTNP